MERHKIEAQPIDMATLKAVVFGGNAGLSLYTPDSLPRKLIVKGRAIISKELIDSLFADQKSRDFVLEGPVTIRGAKGLNSGLNSDERKDLIKTLQAIEGSEIHATNEEIKFE